MSKTSQPFEFWSARSKAKLSSDRGASASWGGALPTANTLGELLAKQLPPSVPVVAPWLHSGESCLLWGGTGTGKSMIALTMALGAAGGGKVLGWEFPKPTRVLFVDGEQSERDLQRRLALLSTGIDGFDAGAAAGNLILMPRAAQSVGTKFLDIASADQAEMLAQDVERQKIGLIVFDNLSTLSDSVDDENSAAAFKPMQILLTRLKKLNVAVILVHHAGKDPGRGFRGSSGIATTFERILGVVHSDAAPVTKIDVTVRLEKFRDEVPESFQPTFPLKFSVSDDAGGRVAKWDVGQLTLVETGWRMFSAGPYSTVAAFVTAFNQQFGTTRSAKNFRRDFRQAWMLDLRKTEQDCDRAEKRMKALRKCDSDEPESEDGQGVAGDY